jgi:hypothetical protein
LAEKLARDYRRFKKYMSNLSTVRVPHSTLDDDAWEDLLSFIEERRVIPIVGPELLQIATDSGPRLLYDWLAQKLASRLNAVARQGRLAEAAQIIAPAVEYQRQLSQHNHGDQWLPLERALGLYAQALSDPAKREALLHEATSLLDSAPSEIRPLHDTRLLRQLIESALHGKPPSST